MAGSVCISSCVDREMPAMPKGYTGGNPGGNSSSSSGSDGNANGSNGEPESTKISITVGGAVQQYEPGTKIPLCGNLIPVLPGNIIKEFRADGNAKQLCDIVQAADGLKITASMAPTSMLTIDEAEKVLLSSKPKDIVNLEVTDLSEKNITNLAAAIKTTKAEINLVIPDGSIQIVADNMFQGCERLTSVILPAALEAVAPSAFKNCKNLRHVAFCAAASSARGKSGSYFDFAGSDAYAKAVSDFIASKNLSPDDYSAVCLRPSKNIVSIAGHYYIIEGTPDSDKPTFKFTDIYYGNGVWWRDAVLSEPLNTSNIQASTYNTTPRTAEKLAIFANAFQGCESLSVVSLPKNVTDLAVGSFAGCTGLSFVDVGNYQINIYGNSFENMVANALVQLPVNINDAALDNFKTAFGEKNVAKK